MVEGKVNQILLVTNGLASFDAVHGTAKTLAQQHGSNATIVDTLRPPGFLSRWISSNAGDVFDMVLSDKQDRLEKLAQQFSDSGISTQVKVLIGASSQSITQEAIRLEADLVVRYKKGTSSKYHGEFGNTARSLMQVCPVPILFVADKPIENPNVLACLDVEHGEAENLAIINQARLMAENSDKLMGVYCWTMFGKDLMASRMSDEDLAETARQAERIYADLLEKFLAEHDTSCFGKGIKLVQGQPSVVIPQLCLDQHLDLPVMCSASLNHPLRRMLGSTVESVIDKLPGALLMVKPLGFVSPIKV